jgi:glycerate 2-kinase
LYSSKKVKMIKFENYRQHTEELFASALAAADPGHAVRSLLNRDGRFLQVGESQMEIGQGRIFLVSVGKAALTMAEAAYEVLGDTVFAARVISKRGAQETHKSPLRVFPNVQLLEGSHPVSGEDSIQSTAQVIEMLGQTTEEDLVICLISGGASALLTQPALSLSDWQVLINALLASGCTINELNTVRRQLDRVKGGGLARIAAPARCISLILSDVVGNPLEVIGSGPTVILAESPAEALATLNRYEIAEAIEAAAYERLTAALLTQESAKESTPPDNEILIVGDVKMAAQAAMAKAVDLGFVAQIVTVHLEGEAREVGRFAAAIAKDTLPGRCLILGGETTVTLQGDGLGGRNLETALSAAIALSDWPRTAIASVATDGEDGPTPAAGAVVSGGIVPYATENNLPAQEYLERNDSYNFFMELDALIHKESQIDTQKNGDIVDISPCLIVTGSTGTNVNDLLFILTYE